MATHDPVQGRFLGTLCRKCCRKNEEDEQYAATDRHLCSERGPEWKRPRWGRPLNPVAVQPSARAPLVLRRGPNQRRVLDERPRDVWSSMRIQVRTRRNV